MRVLIDDALFAPAGGPLLDLVDLFRMGTNGRHLVLPDPLDGSSFRRWIERRDAETQEEIRFAIDGAIERDNFHRPSQTLRIVSRSSNPGAAVPTFTIEEALALLRSPLSLLVENVRHDAAFLRCVARRDQRRALDEAEEKGWIRFEHGGGLEEIQAMVEERGGDSARRLRSWVIFDSDALAPGHPSRPADRLRRLCEKSGIPCHRLQRRAAENYLPPAILEQEARKDPEKQRARAFRRLDPPQRWHFNMKKGFDGDRGRLKEEARGSKSQREAVAARHELYEGLDTPARDLLEKGFGPDTRQHFKSDASLDSPNEFVRDGSTRELHGLVDRILASR